MATSKDLGWDRQQLIGPGNWPFDSEVPSLVTQQQIDMYFKSRQFVVWCETWYDVYYKGLVSLGLADAARYDRYKKPPYGEATWQPMWELYSNFPPEIGQKPLKNWQTMERTYVYHRDRLLYATLYM